jgi:aspartate/methionine/tyrosine aminotransferase
MPESHRLQSVQAPIIPVIADLIQAHPGTISLGQGVVNYGPPSTAIAEITRFLAEPANHKYQGVSGIPILRERITQKTRCRELHLCRRRPREPPHGHRRREPGLR